MTDRLVRLEDFKKPHLLKDRPAFELRIAYLESDETPIINISDDLKKRLTPKGIEKYNEAVNEWREKNKPKPKEEKKPKIAKRKSKYEQRLERERLERERLERERIAIVKGSIEEELRANRVVRDYIGNETTNNMLDFTRGIIQQHLPGWGNKNYTLGQALDSTTWQYLNETDNALFDYTNIITEIEKILSIMYDNLNASILIDIRYQVEGQSDGSVGITDVFTLDPNELGSAKNIPIDAAWPTHRVSIRANNLSYMASDIMQSISDSFSSVDLLVFVSGFSVLIHETPSFQEDYIFRRYIKSLKAYDAENLISQKYHTQTATSTLKIKNCIFQTYYYLYVNQVDLRLQKDQVNLAFANEDEIVRQMVNEGRLIDFLSYISKRQNETMYVELFEPKKVIEDAKSDSDSLPEEIKTIYGVAIYGEKIMEIENKEEFNNQKVFSYYKDHVAPKKPCIYKNCLEKEKQYSIHPAAKKEGKISRKTDCTNIIFDFETFSEDNDAMPFLVGIVADAPIFNGENTINFYGEDSADKAAELFFSLRQINNNSKTHAKGKTHYYNIYGFNNANFDNSFIFTKLLERGASSGCAIIAGKSIKTIELAENIKFFDLKLYYAGSLKDLAKSFKLPMAKGVFPYKFPNRDNLDYVGPVPELKYWNSAEDRDLYIKKNGNIFNMREYSIKYCMLDCELTAQLVAIHRKQANFEVTINREVSYLDEQGDICSEIRPVKISVDATKELTAAGTALKIFTDGFLQRSLYASKDKQIMRFCRESYKGGRTEAFRKYFRRYLPVSEEYTGKITIYNGERCIDTYRPLWYCDLNSSYPSSMTSEMPEGEGKHIVFAEPITLQMAGIYDHYLYKATSSYKGGDKFYIPNLLIKRPDGTNRAMLDTPSAWHWGVELKEAIIAGCEVVATESVYFKSGMTFKEYAESLYAERLKVKNEYNADGTKNIHYNKARAEFIKLLLNSLYGKFGQNIKFSTITFKNVQEWEEHMSQPHISYRSHEILKNGYIHCSFYDKTMDDNSIGQLVRFSSYIAALSRTKLAIIMRRVGYASIYYCDTDSIFCDVEPPKDLIDQTKLGFWKKEDFAVKIPKFDDNDEPMLDIYEDQKTTNYSFDVCAVEADFLAPKCYKYKCRITKLTDSTGDRYVQLEDDEYGLQIPYTFGLFEDERAEYIFKGEKKCKGIPKALLKESHIDRLAAGEKDIAINNPSMFFRSVEGIKIREQQRTINIVANKRKWSGNDSFAFQNLEECNIAEEKINAAEKERLITRKLRLHHSN